MSDRESRAKEANSAGHEAFREGKPREENPFSDGTLSHGCWDLGWASEMRLQAWERDQFKQAAE